MYHISLGSRIVYISTLTTGTLNQFVNMKISGSMKISSDGWNSQLSVKASLGEIKFQARIIAWVIYAVYESLLYTYKAIFQLIGKVFFSLWFEINNVRNVFLASHFYEPVRYWLLQIISSANMLAAWKTKLLRLFPDVFDSWARICLGQGELPRWRQELCTYNWTYRKQKIKFFRFLDGSTTWSILVCWRSIPPWHLHVNTNMFRIYDEYYDPKETLRLWMIWSVVL